MAGVQPTQMLPAYLTYVTNAITYPDGSVVSTTEIMKVPITYYGPSIPLGTDGVWTYGGLVSPNENPTLSTSTPSDYSKSSDVAPSSATPTPESAPASSITSSPTSLDSFAIPSSSSAIPSASGSSTDSIVSPTSATSEIPSLSTTFTSSDTIFAALSSSSASSIESSTPTGPLFSNRLSRGGIIGAVLGSILGLVLLLLLLLLCLRWRRKRKAYHSSTWTGWTFVDPSDPSVAPEHQENAPLHRADEDIPGLALLPDGSPRQSGEEIDPFLNRKKIAAAQGIGAGAAVIATSSGTGSNPSNGSKGSKATGTSSSTAVSDYGVLLSGGTGSYSSPVSYARYPTNTTHEADIMPARPSSELRGGYGAYSGSGQFTRLSNVPLPEEEEEDEPSPSRSYITRVPVPHEPDEDEQLLPPPPIGRFGANAAVIDANVRPTNSSPSPVDEDSGTAILQTARRIPMRASQISSPSHLADSRPISTAAPSTHSDTSEANVGGWGALAVGGVARLSRFTWFRNVRDTLASSSTDRSGSPNRDMSQVPGTYVGRVMTEYDVEAGRALLAVENKSRGYTNFSVNEKGEGGSLYSHSMQSGSSIYHDALSGSTPPPGLQAPGYAYRPLHHRASSSTTSMDALDMPPPGLHPTPHVDVRLPSPYSWDKAYGGDLLETEPPKSTFRTNLPTVTRSNDTGSFHISPLPSSHSSHRNGSTPTTSHRYLDSSVSSRPSQPSHSITISIMDDYPLASPGASAFGRDREAVSHLGTTSSRTLGPDQLSQRSGSESSGVASFLNDMPWATGLDAKKP